MSFCTIERLEIDGVDIALASRRDAIEQACVLVRSFLGRDTACESPNFDVVLRELLANAVCHGNKSSPHKTVRCTVEWVDRAQVRILVQDAGDGFNYGAIDMSLPDTPARAGRRGYPLIYALADRIEFNESGNSTTAYVTLRDPQHSHREGLSRGLRESEKGLGRG